MTLRESRLWNKYLVKHGEITNQHRLEHGFALLALIISKAHGNKNAKLEHFLPRRQLPEEPKEGTIEDVFKMLGGQ